MYPVDVHEREETLVAVIERAGGTLYDQATGKYGAAGVAQAVLAVIALITYAALMGQYLRAEAEYLAYVIQVGRTAEVISPVQYLGTLLVFLQEPSGQTLLVWVLCLASAGWLWLRQRYPAGPRR